MSFEPAVIFKVDGVDFTDCVAASKLKWQKNDIDSDQSGRATDALMQRSVKGKKRKLGVTCVRMSYEHANALATALDKTFVDITYLDLILGVTTKTFYGTSIDSTTVATINGKTFFDDTQFDLVER